MRRRLILAAAVALLAAAAAPASAAAFGFSPGSAGLEVGALDADSGAQAQAGTHPHLLEASLAFDTGGGSERLRDLTLRLAPGLLINPTVPHECKDAAFLTPRSTVKPGSLSGESCPNASQVGVIRVDVGGTIRWFGLFSLVAPFGTTAAIGASPFGTPLVFAVHTREGDAGLDLRLLSVPQGFDLRAMKLTLWGTPAWGNKAMGALSHDPQRGNCLDEETGGSLAEDCQFLGPGQEEPTSLIKSYITLPTTPCGAAPSYTAEAVSWQGTKDEATTSTPPLQDCRNALTTPKVQLMTDAAASRTGLAFNLAVKDGGGILNPGGIARPAIKRAILRLPEGVTINPSLGAGLGVCEEAEFARERAGSEPGAGCPNNSKIGEVEIEGALGLSEALHGSVYLARPHANPFGSLAAVYLLARSPRRGLIVKSIGKIAPEERTGRLTATFEDLPRLLYTHFSLTLREGQRSTLVSPPLCGPYTAALEVASWAEPGVFVPGASLLLINRGEGGGPCPAGGIPPFAPGLLAGSLNPTPTTYTPFYLRMTRSDGEQEITSYSATFPEGLLAKVAGVGECPDAAIEAAKHRSGVAELANPSCPESSKIGRTLAGYGVGGVLAWAPGNLYLAGPYHGSELSVVAIDAATIGPFDLGVVVVRTAVRIDRRSAQASIDAAGSDPIPHIIAGIPIHVRDIRVYVDRPGFTNTPTSCDPMQVSSLLTGAGLDPFSSGDDSAATSTQRYQLLGCSALDFKPKIALTLKGPTRRSRYPSFRAVVKARPGEANIGAASVTLPPSLFLAQEHLRAICTRAQFAADACPRSSIYGHARARTPLMDEPLQGPVLVRSSSNKVPDLIAILRGRGVEIELEGRIDSSRGGLRGTFDGLPDAPLTEFVMTLPGGRRGLLVNADDLCEGPQRANARFIGHNNATEVLHPKLRVKCKPNRRKGSHRPRRGR